MKTSRRTSQTIDRQSRERDLTAPVSEFTDAELPGVIYAMQTRLNTRDARMYGRVDPTIQARLRDLFAENNRRKHADRQEDSK